MARKLIDQEEAARILGVTPEEVGSLRDRKKLFPYRDGADWKYKPEDIERLREEMAEQAAAELSPGDSNVAGGSNVMTSWGEGSDLENIELEVNEDLDSILLSEVELGRSHAGGRSTIIGKSSEAPSEDADVLPAGEPKPKTPAPAPIPPAAESDLKLAASSDIGLAAAGPGSDVRLVAGGSDVTSKPPSAGSSDKLFGSDALSLSDDELSLIDSSVSLEPPKSPSDAKKSEPSAASSLALEDDDMVLGGAGSDVTQSPTDSGIQLISASDSGLSLEEPLAMGSSAKELLELNDSIVASAPGTKEAEAEKADDEFLLTAADELAEEESSDSGSQVIALDADDELSSGMFAPVAGGAMLEEESVPSLGAAPMLGSGPLVTPAMPGLAPTPQMVAAAGTVEAPFSTWNIVALVACTMFLMLCGMMTYDLMRNMWSWDGPHPVNSSILESLGNTIGWFDR